MFLISIAAFLLLAWLIERLDEKRIGRSTERMEQVHQNFYDYVDRCFDGIDAQEKKEAADILIHDYWEQHLGLKYQPKHLKEVTTETGRKRLKKLGTAVVVGGGMPLTNEQKDQMLANRWTRGDVEKLRRMQDEAVRRYHERRHE